LPETSFEQVKLVDQGGESASHRFDLLILATVLMFFSQLLLMLGELNVWGTACRGCWSRLSAWCWC
jgi:hypothetical protein